MDIIGAINKEREYLSFRMKGEEPYIFQEEIKKYGFESIEDYLKAKKDYEFSLLKFEVINIATEEMVLDIFRAIEQQRTAVLFAETDKTLVWNGTSGNLNIEYCTEFNIPIYEFNNGGGTIVSTRGDLNMAISYPENEKFNSTYMLNKIVEIFEKYTDKPIVASGNDILVDGYKVMGSTMYRVNGMFVFAASVSMSEKNQLISNICLKHSTKQPSYIDFMTADQLREEIEGWLKIQ